MINTQLFELVQTIAILLSMFGFIIHSIWMHMNTKRIDKHDELMDKLTDIVARLARKE